MKLFSVTEIRSRDTTVMTKLVNWILLTLHVNVIYIDQIVIDHRYHNVICVIAVYLVYNTLNQDDETSELVQLFSAVKKDYITLDILDRYNNIYLNWLSFTNVSHECKPLLSKIQHIQKFMSPFQISPQMSTKLKYYCTLFRDIEEWKFQNWNLY